MSKAINIFWFRRDLRLEDNAGLYHALNDKNPVLPLFIFDKNILNHLSDGSDRRVEFIHDAVSEIRQQLIGIGSAIDVIYNTPEEAFQSLTKKYQIEKVYTNHDYEAYARDRDAQIKNILAENNIELLTFKDQVVFEKNEVTKDDGKPYTVFTPFSRKWKLRLLEQGIKTYPTQQLFKNFIPIAPIEMISLSEMGFTATKKSFPKKELDEVLVKHYSKQRDIPSINGTSKMGVHLRFGTVSIRSLAIKSRNLSETFLNELIWRDFYHMILWHFPHVNHYKSFKPAYDQIQWRHDEKDFKNWCDGQTGYPIVDAGMRELNTTGFMHNRVRMIVASFLCKHLLIDWRWGEAYFAQKLLDFDFAANNGGWQWAAGSGCDAAPYFRIFNPYLQTKKFDPDLLYIKKWVPEFEELTYPQPIVNHEFARKRCLEVYAKALKG
jgi:deoxyribodipyrimidine photo-lyase